MSTITYDIAYACPSCGSGVRAIDKTWCFECLVLDATWTKVEHR